MLPHAKRKESGRGQPASMIAAVYHKFGGPIQLETVDRPRCPGGDGVVIQCRATGVCRSDWHGWKGHDSDISEHGLPFCPGHEVSGVVVELGDNVTRFRIGDSVAVPFILSCGSCEYCCIDRSTVCLRQNQPGFTQFGSFAEFLAVPRADRNLAKMPGNVSFAQAAALGCRFTTAYRAVVQQGQLQRDDTIAIFGCGGLGLSCILLAMSQGCTTIIAVDVSAPALRKSFEVGATHMINVKGMDSAEVIRRVNAIVSGGAHVTVEASGFSSACENAVLCTRRAGRMVQVGLVSGTHNKPSVPMDIVAGRELHLVGSHGFSAADLPTLLQLISIGKLDPSVLIERHVTLQEGAKAIEEMDNGSPLGITMITQFPRYQTSCRL